MTELHNLLKKEEEEKVLKQIDEIEMSANDSQRMFKTVQHVNNICKSTTTTK